MGGEGQSPGLVLLSGEGWARGDQHKSKRFNNYSFPWIPAVRAHTDRVPRGSTRNLRARSAGSELTNIPAPARPREANPWLSYFNICRKLFLRSLPLQVGGVQIFKAASAAKSDLPDGEAASQSSPAWKGCS